MLIRICVLGPLEIEDHSTGSRVPPRIDPPASGSARELLALLALESSPQTKTEVIELLWPEDIDWDDDVKAARISGRLDQAVLQARRSLGRASSALARTRVTDQAEGLLSLRREQVSVDIDEARELVANGDFEQALALHRGVLLRGTNRAWLDFYRDEQRRQITDAIRALGASDPEGDALVQRVLRGGGTSVLGELSRGARQRQSTAIGSRAARADELGEPAASDSPFTRSAPVTRAAAAHTLTEAELRTILASSLPAGREDAYFSVHYRTEGAGVSPQHLAGYLAVNSAVGSLTPLPWGSSDMPPYVLGLQTVGPYLRFEVAYPVAILGEHPSIPPLLSLLWLASEYADTKNVWVDDIRLPASLVASFPGPRRGAPGFREKLGVDGRPLISAIVKPRYGGDLRDFLNHAAAALRGGADGLVDDELLVDPLGGFAFEQRIAALVDAASLVSEETNEPKYVFANVTASHRRAEELAVTADGLGAAGVIANPFTMGYGSFQDLAEVIDDLDSLLIDCSIGAGMISLPTAPCGTSVSVLAKLSRLAGADAVHSGSEGEHWYTPELLRDIRTNLSGEFYGRRPCLPVIAGAVNAGNVWQKLQPFGIECMVNAGSGIWGHPLGAEAGAAAIRAVIDQIGTDLSPEQAHERMEELARSSPAVREAFNQFGYVKPYSPDLQAA